jgi:hypothetical protein
MACDRTPSGLLSAVSRDAVEFAVQPGPGGSLDQCRDVDSDPARIQRVLFFPHASRNARLGSLWKPGCQPVNSLAYDRFHFFVAHEASVFWNPWAVNPFPAEFEPVQVSVTLSASLNSERKRTDH